jgi:hypothetical protein
MHPIRFVFPGYASAFDQTRIHGTDGVNFVHKAVQAPDNGARLDAAVRALNGFDHAITTSSKLPLQKVIPDLAVYRMGYKAAKTAVELLVRSGVIPGARERVGKQELLAAGAELHRGIDYYRTDDSRYGRYRALNDVSAAIEDAKYGLSALRKPDIATPLLKGLSSVGSAISAKKPVSAELVSSIDKLLAQATGELDRQIAAAKAAPIADGSQMVEQAKAELQSVSAG